MDEIYFDEDGFVSIWLGMKHIEENSNFLKELYNVDFHDPDEQECFIADKLISISELISQLSYSQLFYDSAMQAAQKAGIDKALWAMAQYDFLYDGKIAGLKTTPTDPVFLGAFNWYI